MTARTSRFRSEIAEQPEVAARLLARGAEAASSIAARVREAAPRGFVIAARGSSDHAALYAKYLFGVRNQYLVALAAPSLFTHYARPPRLDGQSVIGISQSGESPDVIAVIEEARRHGALTLAITNDPRSKLAASAELVLALQAGPEVSVPASKTYTASLLALASAWSVADFEHGPIAVVEEGLPALIVDGGGLVAANLEAVKARLQEQGCKVLHLLDVSGLPEELTPITLAVSGQLLAHHVAVARGFDPDRPRTIQKVTRTW